MTTRMMLLNYGLPMSDIKTLIGENDNQVKDKLLKDPQGFYHSGGVKFVKKIQRSDRASKPTGEET